ncbi:MAG: hypothetical protein CNIPEHKO_00889 [Anaerolineales bacterium]|nr:hypothetical protein [Anaerolineales bacterium]
MNADFSFLNQRESAFFSVQHFERRPYEQRPTADEDVE